MRFRARHAAPPISCLHRLDLGATAPLYRLLPLKPVFRPNMTVAHLRIVPACRPGPRTRCPLVSVRSNALISTWDRNKVFKLSHHCKQTTCAPFFGTLSQKVALNGVNSPPIFYENISISESEEAEGNQRPSQAQVSRRTHRRDS